MVESKLYWLLCSAQRTQFPGTNNPHERTIRRTATSARRTEALPKTGEKCLVAEKRDLDETRRKANMGSDRRLHGMKDYEAIDMPLGDTNPLRPRESCVHSGIIPQDAIGKTLEVSDVRITS